jgi:hypothetical protein
MRPIWAEFSGRRAILVVGILLLAPLMRAGSTPLVSSDHHPQSPIASMHQPASLQYGTVVTETGLGIAADGIGLLGIREQPRCKATTKKGTRCKRNAKDGSEYCWQHQKLSDAERCRATTKAGKRCSRRVSKGSDYCWQHDR